MLRGFSDRRVVDKIGTGPRVLAAGLSRCATSSLQVAFENHLGEGPCMHMAHIVTHPDRLRMFGEAALETDKERRQAMIRPFFDDYNSSSDCPGMMFVEDIVEMYPNCKIILNKRKSGEVWAKSLTDTLWWFMAPDSSYRWVGYLIAADREHHRLHMTLRKVLRQRYRHYDVQEWNDPKLLEAHNDFVRKVARVHHREVLEWEPTDGWETLCEFLHKPVPTEPFPHANDAAAMRFFRRLIIARGLFCWGTLLSLPVFAYYASSWLFG